MNKYNVVLAEDVIKLNSVLEIIKNKFTVNGNLTLVKKADFSFGEITTIFNSVKAIFESAEDLKLPK